MIQKLFPSNYFSPTLNDQRLTCSLIPKYFFIFNEFITSNVKKKRFQIRIQCPHISKAEET